MIVHCWDRCHEQIVHQKLVICLSRDTLQATALRHHVAASDTPDVEGRTVEAGECTCAWAVAASEMLAPDDFASEEAAFAVRA